MNAAALGIRMAVTLLLGVSISSPALAGPPYNVDDPGTLDHRRGS